MAVNIASLDDTRILVNTKIIRRDMDGNWNCDKELSCAEKKYFGEYLELLELTSAKSVEATFKG